MSWVLEFRQKPLLSPTKGKAWHHHVSSTLSRCCAWQLKKYLCKVLIPVVGRNSFELKKGLSQPG